MSEAGSTRFPNPIGANTPSSRSSGGIENVLDARLIGNARLEADEAGKIIRLRGKVLALSAEGRVRIQTERGPIEVQLPKDTSPRGLRAGQNIEIEIPPERVRARSENAVQIRIAEENRASPPPTAPRERATIDRNDAASANNRPATAENQRTSKPDQYTQPLQPSAPISGMSGLEQLIGTTIRIDPLPPNSAAAIISQAAQMLQNLPMTLMATAYPAPTAQAALPSINLPQTANIIQYAPVNFTPTQQAISILNQYLQINAQSAFYTPPNAVPISFQAVSNISDISDISDMAAPLPQSANLNQFASIYPQPIDIKSNFLFLSPDTIRLAGDLSGLTISESLQQAAPSITKPFTAEISAVRLPVIPNPFLTGATALPSPNTGGLLTAPPLPETGSKATATIMGFTEKSLPVVSLAAQGSIYSPFQNQVPNQTQNAAPLAISAQSRDLFVLNIPVQHIPLDSQITLSLPPSGLWSGDLSGLTAPLTSTQAAALGSALPPEMQIQLQGQAQAQTAPTPQTFAPLLPHTMLHPEHWPALEDVIKTLNIAGIPSHAAGALPNAANPAQMGALMLFVMAAIRSGDLSQILNERTQDILRRAGKSSLLSRLGQEGALLGRLNAEPLSQDWRSFALPMQSENEVHKLILHYRHERNQDDEGESGGGKLTRFIFDLSLSRMGNVQLDGLFRKNRLDIILRTHQAFSDNTRAAFKASYHDALQSAGFDGELSFQSDPKHWVTFKRNQNTLSQNI
ncbi:MAG: hypothetical protein ACK4VI_01580 [Alphaproteobacteria bacterium]